MTFDGAHLAWGTQYKDKDSIPQAERTAATFAKWLNGSSGATHQVHPIVAIPGWFVDRKRKGQVYVLNDKELIAALPTLGTDRLSNKTIRELASRIEDMCRNVEGD